MGIFSIGDVTANDVIQINHRHKKKMKLSSIVITDVKLASYFKKTARKQEHCHSKISGAWLCEYVSVTVLF